MKQVFRAHLLCEQDSPLGPYMDSYCAEMRGEGYARQTSEVQIRLVADFGHWLARHRIQPQEITAELFQPYLRARARRRRPTRNDSSALHRLLNLLVQQGVVPAPALPTATPAERLQSEFRLYLQQERALASITQAHYLTFLGEFLAVDGSRRQALRRLLGEAIMKSKASLAALLESFFTQRLMNQRQASPHTISSYRDTFRLLLLFAREYLHKPPARLAFEEIDAPMIAAFLDDLEKSRGITARSRNLRLTAIRSFFHYAAYEEPSRAAQIQRVLAVPGKRHTRNLVHFLDRPEIDALLAAPDQATWFGRRDHGLLLVAVQTGLRLSELTGLQRSDVVLGTGANVRCVGKGRKERCTPLAKTTVAVLKAWLREPPRRGAAVLFPNARGGRLSSDSVADLLAKHVARASEFCPSLRKKHVTPHVLRHSMAMGLLQAGVDRAVIALWLGHESVETTQIYLEANLAMKDEILAKTTPLGGNPAAIGLTTHSSPSSKTYEWLCRESRPSDVSKPSAHGHFI